METTKPAEDQGVSPWSSWVATNKDFIPRGGVREGEKRGEKEKESSPSLTLMLLTEINFYPCVQSHHPALLGATSRGRWKDP